MVRIPALALLIVLAACERPFVEVGQPNVVIVAPDLSLVQLESLVELKVRAASFRSIDAVAVNGTAMQYFSNERVWALSINLRRGVNELIFDTSDIEGISTADTAYALFLPVQHVANSPALPSPRGGHTTTRLFNNDIVVIGGVSHVDGPAHSTLFFIPHLGSIFSGSTAELSHARTGHTATLMSDGRVLVVGGSRSGSVVSVADLVETPEAYDPATQTFQDWVVVGQPIRRTHHVAVFRRTGDGEFLDLHGGLGDTRYGNDPFLGIRPDLRSFRIGNDTLWAENSLATAPYLGDAIYGHTLNRIQIGPYYVFGARFESNFEQETSFSFEFTPQGARIGDASPLHIPRTHHAAAPVLNNLLVLTGGRQHSTADIVMDTELYSQRSGASYRLARRAPILSRFGHTATTVGTSQVLILGGFGPDGTARAASEFFVVLPENPSY